MKIIVCIKQVIYTDQVNIDPRTHSLIRTSERSRMNPFDIPSLIIAKELKKAYSGSIVALTMGPPISKEVLWEALAMGVDRAILLSDPHFSASDTLATSYVLGMAIRKIGDFDLILCGARTTDSDTGHIGPQLAEELCIPHVTGVEKIERMEDYFRVERLSDGFREVIEVSKPVLFAISSKLKIRFPSLIEIEDAFLNHQIETWDLEDLNADPVKVGISGSETMVEDLIPVDEKGSCFFIDGDPVQQAKTLFLKLKEKNLL